MQTLRIVCSLWLSLVIGSIAAPGFAQNGQPASGQTPAAQPTNAAAPADAPVPAAAPARPSVKPRTEAEKAAGRAKADAEMRLRAQEATARQKEAYLAQVAPLGLSAEQIGEVEGLAARQDAWQRDNAAQIAALRDRMIAARAGSDMQSVKASSEELQKLMRTRPDLDDILTPEQFEKMNSIAVEKMQATHGKLTPAPAVNPTKAPAAPKEAPEVEAIMAKMKAARLTGDTAEVGRLKLELQMLKQAVRKARAADAAAGQSAPK